MSEESKQELCAIPKEYAERQLKKLIENNQEVFDEYIMWQNVIKSQVSVASEDKPTKSDDEVKDPDASDT